MRLNTATAFLACCCSLNLSALGKPLDPGTPLRIPPGCTGDMTKRLAAQVELESGGPPPVACQVVGVGQPPSNPDSASHSRSGLRAASQPGAVSSDSECSAG